MSVFVDLKYVASISHLLQNFKKKGDYVWQFRCFVCGDSAKNKTKTRGHILRHPKGDGLYYKCHNCGITLSFGELLRRLDTSLLKEYRYESFLEKGSNSLQAPKQKPTIKLTKESLSSKFITKPTPLIGCPSIESLDDDHPAKEYLLSRRIPKEFHKQLYWADDFPELALKVDPNIQVDSKTNKPFLRQEGRIIIPLLDTDYQLLGVQGRCLTKDGLRYITIKSNPESPKIYGLHRLGKVLKRVYIVEGPFDSMFLPECLAATGSDIPSNIPKEKSVIIYDNEPRSAEICKKIEKVITQGYRVMIWPESIKQKDINDMVLAGYTPDRIKDLIDRNSYMGLTAEFKYERWKK